MSTQNPPPQSRGVNGGGGPFFYPKVSSTTSAYNSRPAPSPASFQLHNVQAGPSRSQGSLVGQRVARDINYGGQRGNGAEAVAGDQRRPRLQGRQAGMSDCSPHLAMLRSDRYSWSSLLRGAAVKKDKEAWEPWRVEFYDSDVRSIEPSLYCEYPDIEATCNEL